MIYLKCNIFNNFKSKYTYRHKYTSFALNKFYKMEFIANPVNVKGRGYND